MKETRNLHKEMAPAIVDWFYENGRLLPWRDTVNPYHILVSEVMLQQTQVATVIPYYFRFIKALPTLEHLAAATDDELHSLWEGLGYYSRVMRLRQFALEVVNKYSGVIPNTKEQLLVLPGIGPYTCGALLSFAFHMKAAAVDGNVKRVLSRQLSDFSDVSKKKTIDRFEAELMKIIPDDAYGFNQGMIELGAVICKPKNPDCKACPIQRWCSGFELNVMDQLPYKPAKVKKKILEPLIFVIEESGELLFVKRGPKGILSSMWGLPIIEETLDSLEINDQLQNYMQDWFEIDIDDFIIGKDIQLVGKVKHVFTHRIWEQQIYYFQVKGLKKALESIEYPVIRWERSTNIPLPTAFRKVLETYQQWRNGNEQ